MTQQPLPGALDTFSTWKNDAALLFVVIVWGVNFAVVKAALEIMHPHVLNTFRFIVSAVVLGGLYILQQHRAEESFFRPLKMHRREIIALGLLGFFFYQFCFIVGVNNTKAGSAALIMASAPLWTAVLSHFFAYENLPKAAWIGLLTTFAGVIVIVLGGSNGIDFGDENLFGNLITMLAAMLWGAYTAFAKPVSKHTSPVSISFLGLLFALPLLFGLGMPYFSTVEWENVDLWIWLAILFSTRQPTVLTAARGPDRR